MRIAEEEVIATTTGILTDPNELKVYETFLAVVRLLVDRPEDVVIVPVLTPTALNFQVQTHPADIGKLVGKSGRTARALRVILSANAARLGKDVGLDIVSGQESGVWP